MTELARKQFVAWQAGKINKSLYTAGVQDKLTDEKIDQASHGLGRLGALTGAVYIGPLIAPDIPSDAHGYIYQMNCIDGTVYLLMILDSQGKIATIFFKDTLTTETVQGPPQAGPPAPGPSATPR